MYRNPSQNFFPILCPRVLVWGLFFSDSPWTTYLLSKHQAITLPNLAPTANPGAVQDPGFHPTICQWQKHPCFSHETFRSLLTERLGDHWFLSSFDLIPWTSKVWKTCWFLNQLQGVQEVQMLSPFLLVACVGSSALCISRAISLPNLLTLAGSCWYKAPTTDKTVLEHLEKSFPLGRLQKERGSSLSAAKC